MLLLHIQLGTEAKGSRVDTKDPRGSCTILLSIILSASLRSLTLSPGYRGCDLKRVRSRVQWFTVTNDTVTNYVLFACLGLPQGFRVHGLLKS